METITNSTFLPRTGVVTDTELFVTIVHLSSNLMIALRALSRPGRVRPINVSNAWQTLRPESITIPSMLPCPGRDIVGVARMCPR